MALTASLDPLGIGVDSARLRLAIREHVDQDAVRCRAAAHQLQLCRPPRNTVRAPALEADEPQLADAAIVRIDDLLECVEGSLREVVDVDEFVGLIDRVDDFEPNVLSGDRLRDHLSRRCCQCGLEPGLALLGAPIRTLVDVKGIERGAGVVEVFHPSPPEAGESPAWADAPSPEDEDCPTHAGSFRSFPKGSTASDPGPLQAADAPPYCVSSSSCSLSRSSGSGPPLL